MPDPSTLKDMDKAAVCILNAVQKRENIYIFADYDVDGGTSAAQLIRWGRAMGVDFGLYVPDRVKEGYGPSIDAFKSLKKRDAELVITVDCGAAATEALIVAKDIDLPIIVIDHHLMEGAMPPCEALVNPNRADDSSGLGHLAAAGVTFLLLAALNREARRRVLEVPDLLSFLDLTALGTICDVVPLIGLNRAYVAQGLKVLFAKPNPGLAALARVAGTSGPYTTYHGGFILGPRINAGGRIGQADMGAKLLSSDNEELIEKYAHELDVINTQRKELQDRILIESLELAQNLPDDHQVIIVSMTGWHAGIIGIVAGRLKDRFGKPAIVIGIDDEGLGKGSGRSIAGVNLGAAIYKAKQEGFLIAGGGHEMAAGLTIDSSKIEEFREFIETVMSEEIREARKSSGMKIDALLSASAANSELIAQINKCAPYGTKNPEPVFAFPDMRVTFAKRLNGGHVRCGFEDNSGGRINGIVFRAEESRLADVLLMPNPPRVHIAGRLKENTWQGRTKIDLTVTDIAIAD